MTAAPATQPKERDGDGRAEHPGTGAAGRHPGRDAAADHRRRPGHRRRGVGVGAGADREHVPRGGRRPGPGHPRHRPLPGHGPAAGRGLPPEGAARPAHRGGVPGVLGRVRQRPLPQRRALHRPRRPPHRPERRHRPLPAEGRPARDPLPRNRSQLRHDHGDGTPHPVDRRRLPGKATAPRRRTTRRGAAGDRPVAGHGRPVHPARCAGAGRVDRLVLCAGGPPRRVAGPGGLGGDRADAGRVVPRRYRPHHQPTVRPGHRPGHRHPRSSCRS